MIRFLVPLIAVVVLFCWWLVIVVASYDNEVIPWVFRLRLATLRAARVATEALSNITTAFAGIAPIAQKASESMQGFAGAMSKATVEAFGRPCDNGGDER